MISSSIDVNDEGANSRKEAPNDAARSAGPRASSSQLWKIVLGLIAFVAVSWVGNAALMVTAVNNLTKDLKVEDGSLKNTAGGSVSTHNQKTTYSISQDFEKNASESRRRLQAGGRVQVAAVTCPVVRQAIKSIQDGDNEGVVEMAVGAGFLTASVTANFYHAEVSSGTFGIERIHLDGNLDFAFAVECEEASCTVAGYKCPVLGLAVNDEGRRRLGDDAPEDEESCQSCKAACQASGLTYTPFCVDACVNSADCGCFGRERTAACRLLDGGASAAAAHSACWGAAGSEAGGGAAVVAAELVLMLELVAGATSFSPRRAACRASTAWSSTSTASTRPAQRRCSPSSTRQVRSRSPPVTWCG